MTARPLKLLRVIGRMGRGGIETSIMHLLRTFDRGRIQTDFLYVDPDGPSVYDDEIRSLGAAIYPCPRRDLLRFAPRFRRINEQHGPYDVMHASLHRFNGYVARVAASAGIRSRIVHSHADTSFVDDRAGLLRRAYLAQQRRWIWDYATLGLAVSHNSAKSLYGPRWRQDSRWRVCYQGRDLEPYTAIVDRDAVRTELGIPSDAYVLGLVGRMAPEKNPHFLLPVLEAARRLNVRAHLLLIGTGPLEHQMRASIRDRGLAAHVTMAGDRRDIVRLLLGAFDVFVMPSLYEGLPMAMVEAQAAGVPCVAADTITSEAQVVPELVRWLSLDESAERWAQAALEPKRIPREAALAQVSQSPFNMTSYVERFERIYRGETEAPR